MEILKKISIRLAFAALLFFIANAFYAKYQFEKDIRRFSRVKNQIDSAFALGEIIYMGESSNTSFNPWTDTLTNSISDFMQRYLPDKKITAITHESYHPGLFREMLNLLPDDGKKRTLIITMNMRTCGPTATFSGNEASNRQEALFYSKRPALLTRIFLSLHFYDNRNPGEMERLKFQWWRTHRLDEKGFSNPFPTVKKWLDFEAASSKPEVWRHMADAYIKEFGFILNENTARVRDLDAIVQICKKKNIHLIYHLLPESRQYARALFNGNQLLQYMDYNAAYLANRYRKMGVTVVDNYKNSCSYQYTDQWYPTEHFNAVIRKMIAKSIAEIVSGKNLQEFTLTRNNWPNPQVFQPMADTMIERVQGKRMIPCEK